MPVVINGSTGISGVDGSAGTPAYQGSDTNTGVFFPAADTIAFGEGGAEVMRIDSSGNVGIGTSTIPGRLVLSTATNSNHLYLTGAQQNAMQFQSATAGSGFIVGRSLSGNNANDFFIYDLVANANRLQIDPSGNLLFNSGYGSAATAYGCRAWVNFNGTGVVAIRASGNVTAITDNGTGDYTVNFTNAMPDANYSFVGTSSDPNDDSVGPVAVGMKSSTYVPTTTARRFETAFNGTSFDSTFVSIAVFR